MKPDWPERLPPEFYLSLDQFNREEFFACHETLEALWIPERNSIRELYQGILQVGVGCYHLSVRANRIGAIRKLDAGARRLEKMGIDADQYGVDWAALIDAADKLRAHVSQLGPEEVSQFDHTLLPRIRYRRPA
jgi:hypothetical protein